MSFSGDGMSSINVSNVFSCSYKFFLGFGFYGAGAVGEGTDNNDWMDDIQKEDLVPLFNEHDTISLNTEIKMDKYQQKLQECGVTLIRPEDIISCGLNEFAGKIGGLSKVRLLRSWFEKLSMISE